MSSEYFARTVTVAAAHGTDPSSSWPGAEVGPSDGALGAAIVKAGFWRDTISTDW